MVSEKITDPQNKWAVNTTYNQLACRGSVIDMIERFHKVRM